MWRGVPRELSYRRSGRDLPRRFLRILTKGPTYDVISPLRMNLSRLRHQYWRAAELYSYDFVATQCAREPQDNPS